jgi:hypothetical protein
VVHFQRGKIGDAIKEFETSLELKKTAAALGMLVRAYLALPDLERHDKVRAELRTVPPVTPEDYMCRGFALTFDRAQSIADLDKAIEMRDSPLARAFRAFTLSFIVLDTQDPKLLNARWTTSGKPKNGCRTYPSCSTRTARSS